MSLETLREIQKIGWEFTEQHQVANMLASQAPTRIGLSHVKQPGRFLWVFIEPADGVFAGNSVWDQCQAAESIDGPRISLGNRHGLANFVSNWMRADLEEPAPVTDTA